MSPQELKIYRYPEDVEKIYAKFYRVGVAAGFPSPAEDFMVQPLSLDERFVQDPNTTFFVEFLGDSMFPTIQKGDTGIIKSNLPLLHDRIGIFSFENTEFTAKRYDAKRKLFVADNPRYPNIEITQEKEQTIFCLGIVQTIFRDML